MNSFYGEVKRYKPPPTVAPIPAPPSLPKMPAFPWFSPEEKRLWTEIGCNPEVGWNRHGIPAFTTNYRNLEKFTGAFPDNGQPPEVNRRRIWATSLMLCLKCSGIATNWIDPWTLHAGYYCDTCHADYLKTSYLRYELDRKPVDSVISDYTGYLSNNPDFQSFLLWVPGKITYLGAAMGQGKTTEIFKSLAIHTPGHAGIILVPRISLAQALAAQFRYEHGHQAWGLFHEGSGFDNRFIGRYGAIGCLSSLPAIRHQAKEQNIDYFKIAIDESDFSYQLKALQPKRAQFIRNELTEACKKEGLLVAGQTESLLELEALALETGIKKTDLRGFYARNATTTGSVSLVQYPHRKGETRAVRLQGTIESIKHHLRQQKRVYAFFNDRRDVRTVAQVFAERTPLCYTAYTKGEKRAKAFLRNQKLTDTRLFLATSAACVGINIHDPDGITVILTGQRFGQRPWKEVIQESLRNRARTPVEIHYTQNTTALPVKPSEAFATSMFHEAMKDYKANHPGVSEHAARAYALSTLADAQSETYIIYHLQEIAGMTVKIVQGNDFDAEILQKLKRQAKQAIQHETDAVKARARIYLSRDDIWTEADIRRRSINANIDNIAHLAHEKLNGYCQVVGWDGESEIQLTNEQKQQVLKLIDEGTDTNKLIKRRRGWLATRFPAFDEQLFGKERADAFDTNMESQALTDDRFRGELLRALLNGLKGRMFTRSELGHQIINLLTTPRGKSNDTLLSLLQKGALGTATYRQVRFIGRQNPTATVDWVRRFIPEWFPAHIKKEHGKDAYALTPLAPDDVANFQMWAKYRYGVSLDTTEDITHVELPSEQAKQEAIELRRQGKTFREIARETGISKSEVARQTKGKKASAQERILQVLNDGKPHQAKDIVARSNVSLKTFHREIKKIDSVQKVKTGVYQLL